MNNPLNLPYPGALVLPFDTRDGIKLPERLWACYRGQWGEYFSNGDWIKSFTRTNRVCSHVDWLSWGYTHWSPSQKEETVPKRSFDELNEAHKKALERLTNQERDHQAYVKKLKERIQELELTPPNNLYVSYTTYSGVCADADRYRKGRDDARKTLADVRDLLNGIKI